uniref:Uncharacterized protein n=1 Tax=Anopheles maculatus TaxID=74869 RepID=A0A182SCY2_9DIPT
MTGEKPAAMQHPNKNPTATSGASATGLSLTAYRCGWLRPRVDPGSTYWLVCLLPATISLITMLTCWSVAPCVTSTIPSRPTAGHKRRRHETPYHVAKRPALHCILTVLLHFVKTIFSKSIKLFDVV